MTPRSPGRPLGPVEKLFWMLDFISSMNLCTMAELQGPLDPDRLEAALGRAQKSHFHATTTIRRTPKRGDV